MIKTLRRVIFRFWDYDVKFLSLTRENRDQQGDHWAVYITDHTANGEPHTVPIIHNISNHSGKPYITYETAEQILEEYLKTK